MFVSTKVAKKTMLCNILHSKATHFSVACKNFIEGRWR